MFWLNAWAMDAMVRELNRRFAGSLLIACFSSSKDEWYLHTSSGVFQIKFYGRYPYFLFPDADRLPVKNRKVFLKSQEQLHIKSIQSIIGDRSFRIDFGHLQLWFNMFGVKSEIYVCENNQPMRSFRNPNLLPENKFDINFRQRDEDRIAAADFNSLKEWIPSFPDQLEEQAKDLNYFNGNITREVHEFLRNSFSEPWHFIEGTPPDLSLQSKPDSKKFQSHLDALHYFSVQSMRYLRLAELKETGIQTEKLKIKRLSQKMKSLEHTLNHYQSGSNYQQKADILMANLHLMQKGLKKVELFNFYLNRNEIISLNPELNPQQNAERFYRKGKKEHLEWEFMQQSLLKMQEELKRSKLRLNDWMNQSVEEINIKPPDIARNESRPQRKTFVFEVENYEIWVGRNAKDNDDLLRRAHKNDLWLHARNVKGAHVIIRCGNKSHPSESVIEHAAQLAAFNSDARGSEWVAVMMTERKYVRKKKGMAPGEVMVEREKTVMAEPRI